MSKLISLKLFIAISLSFLATPAFSQRQNLYFFTPDGSKTMSADSMSYFRIVREPDSGSVLYPVFEYYKNKKPKLIGHSSTIDPPMYDGQVITFHPDGKRETIAQYLKGRPIYSYYSYNKNGTLHAEEYYDSVLTSSEIEAYKIKILNDTAGNPMVIDGNGYYKGPAERRKNALEEGNVVNGYKNGEWKGNYPAESITYAEQYNHGILAGGTCTTAAGKTYTYTHSAENASFPGGLTALYNFIGKKIRYPAASKNAGISGRVIVQFVINKAGAVTDIHVVRAPDTYLADEAVRVFKLISPWQPGIRDGHPVNVQFTIPVQFTAGG